MFHQAGVLFKGKAFDVLDRRLSKQNKFKDISTKRFKQLGISYWTMDASVINYTNKVITNLESITFIKTCLQNLIPLRETPLIALQSKNDTFGVPESDPAFQELLTAIISDLEMLQLHEILVLLIGGIIDVIQRQMYMTILKVI